MGFPQGGDMKAPWGFYAPWRLSYLNPNKAKPLFAFLLRDISALISSSNDMK